MPDCSNAHIYRATPRHTYCITNKIAASRQIVGKLAKGGIGKRFVAEQLRDTLRATEDTNNNKKT